MSTHLVETSEEDSFLAVARHVGDLLNQGEERTALAETTGSRFTAECEQLLGEQRFGQLFERLVGALDGVFSQASNKDLECCLNILCHLVPRMSPAEAAPAVDRLAKMLTAKTDEAAEVRLAALVELYNVAYDPAPRYAVLQAALEYATAAGLQDQLTPVVKGQLDGWVRELALSPAQQRALCLAAAALYRASKRKRMGAREAVALSVRAFDGLPAAEAPSVKGAALAAVCDFVRHPELYSFDAWESPAVQQLSGDKEGAGPHALLGILLHGGVQEFNTFAAKNGAVFAAVGASQEEALAKCRLMTLAAMAAASAEVAFPDIAAALQVPEEEVEGWVVRAIGRGVLEGRIDQLRGVISVTQATSRAFGAEQWGMLRERLGVWREHVASMQDAMASQRTALPRGISAPPAGIKA